MEQYYYKKIKLTSLLVNPENPRFDKVDSQIEAIERMIEDQETTGENNKLYNLIKDIVNFGLNPSDLVIVCPAPDEENMFTVLEGNRRIIALKLLFNPDLIPDKYNSLKKKFKELHERTDLSRFEEINCVVISEEDADHWIEVKHAGELKGVGTVRWDTKQQQRFRKKGSPALQIIEFVQNSNEFDEITKQNTNEVPLTNLNRLLDDPDVREVLGLELKDGIITTQLPEKEVAKGLTKIINDLATKINVKDIYYKEDRKKYLESFKQDELPNRDVISETKWNISSVDSNNLTNQNNSDGFSGNNQNRNINMRERSKPLSTERKYLIPKQCIIKIDNPRLNSIYHEMKNLVVEDFPNSAAVMLRVFLELSVDYFIDKNKGSFVVNENTRLVNRIDQVIKFLENNKILDKDQLKPIHIAVSSPHSIFSTNTLNAYIHNRHIQPNPKDLKQAWDNIELFVKTLLTT